MAPVIYYTLPLTRKMMLLEMPKWFAEMKRKSYPLRLLSETHKLDQLAKLPRDLLVFFGYMTKSFDTSLWEFNDLLTFLLC